MERLQLGVDVVSLGQVSVILNEIVRKSIKTLGRFRVNELESPVRVSRSLDREFPGASYRATECVINLLRADSLVSSELNRRFREFGLSVATFNVLMILRGAGRQLCPFEIGERLLVTRGTVTGLLDSLEKQGLISRGAHPDDRRMLHIEMTPKGQELLDELLPNHFRVEVEMMTVLTAAEKQELVRLLGKIEGHLQSWGARS